MSEPERPGSGSGGEGPGTVTTRPVGPEDVGTLLELLRELADYERLGHELQATEELFTRALFSERPAAEALIGELDGEVGGYALYYPTFSTFLAIQGVWLEDLYVRPTHRRSGLGKALLAAVAERTRERGGERLEWSALDWNDLALDFYEGLGAKRMDEWVTHRLIGEDLRALAARAPQSNPTAGG